MRRIKISTSCPIKKTREMVQPNSGLSSHQTSKLLVFLLYICLLCIPQGLYIPFSSASDDADTCSMYDSCSVKDYFRTCSCDSDCYRYGTCCQNAAEFNRMADWSENFQCYSWLTPSPVFTKKVCADDWQGDQEIADACVRSAMNLSSDLMSHVLVSSNRTSTTYWNWNCALCNHENIPDLSFWTVQVSCPLDLTGMSITDARKNFHFDASTQQWGIEEHGRFLSCPISFYQPAFLNGRLKLCAPNMTSDCPSDWKNENVRWKCLSYHSERRLKMSQTYFKNVQCAVCNGVALKDLDCYGRNYRSSASDSRALKIVYNLNLWSGEFSLGYKSCEPQTQRYDPFLQKCRDLKCALNDSILGVNKCMVSGCGCAKESFFLYCFIVIMPFLPHILRKQIF